MASDVVEILETVEGHLGTVQTALEGAAAKIDAQAAEITRLRAELAAAEAKAEALAKALEPFANCIFNDNGDLTVTFRSFTSDELTTAYFTRKQFLTAYRNKENDDGR